MAGEYVRTFFLTPNSVLFFFFYLSIKYKRSTFFLFPVKLLFISFEPQARATRRERTLQWSRADSWAQMKTGKKETYILFGLALFFPP